MHHRLNDCTACLSTPAGLYLPYCPHSGAGKVTQADLIRPPKPVAPAPPKVPHQTAAGKKQAQQQLQTAAASKKAVQQERAAARATAAATMGSGGSRGFAAPRRESLLSFPHGHRPKELMVSSQGISRWHGPLVAMAGLWRPQRTSGLCRARVPVPLALCSGAS